MKELSPWGAPQWGAAVGVGILLCVALMGGAWFDLGSHLPGYYNDDWGNGIYLHHQVHAALLDGRFDLSDPMQFHPIGYNPVHTNGGNILEMLVSGVCRLFLPWPLWLSVASLAWIPLNLLAFVPLGRRLWNKPSVVIAGASTWALFPPVLDHIGAGRLTQAALVGLPVAIAGLMDLAQGGGRRARWMTALGWALIGLGYWYNAVFFGMVLPVFWWCLKTAESSTSLARDMVQAALMALGMVSPFLLVVFWPVLSGGAMPGSHIDPTQMNIVFPDALHLFGGQTKGLVNWLPYSMMVGLVAFGVWGRQRRLWGTLIAVGVVCALGPGQEVLGTAYRMPYWVFWKFVPGLAGMFHPDRWILVTGLFMSVAAIDGLRNRFPRMVWLIPLGVLAQLWVRGVAPLPVWEPTTPPHWQALAEDSDSGAVIVVPMDHGQLASQYQRVHGRPLLGGMIEDQPWRHPEEWTAYVRSNRFLKSLRAVSYGQDVPIDLDDDALRTLRADGFDRVVFDRASWVNARRNASVDPVSRLRETLGAPLMESTSGAVWALPEPKEL